MSLLAPSGSAPVGLNSIEIGVANEADVAGVHALMQANLAARGGSLSASFSPEQIAARLLGLPMIVARHGDAVVGFLMTGSREVCREVPILEAMLAAYPGADDAYVYGPICVAAAHRGRCLAQAMASELVRHLPGREGILFIRRDNVASLRAHARMGMREAAAFTFAGCAHVVLTYGGGAG